MVEQKIVSYVCSLRSDTCSNYVEVTSGSYFASSLRHSLIQKLSINLNYSARRHEPPYLLDGNSKDGYHVAVRFHLTMPIFVLPLSHSHWKSLVTWTDLSNGHIDEHAIKDGESATSV